MCRGMWRVQRVWGRGRGGGEEAGGIWIAEAPGMGLRLVGGGGVPGAGMGGGGGVSSSFGERRRPLSGEVGWCLRG